MNSIGLLHLDKYQSIELGNGLDTVLHLILSHLNQPAIALLPHHGIQAVPRHPGVHLDLLQLDPLAGVLDQHLTQQLQELRGEMTGAGDVQGLGPDLVVDHDNVVILKWKTTKDETVESDPQRPNISRLESINKNVAITKCQRCNIIQEVQSIALHFSFKYQGFYRIQTL